jgi:hypothetical protein
MAAITGTLASQVLSRPGGTKQITVTATVGSASDTITLTTGTHGIASINGIVGAVITGGLDAAFSYLQVSYSGLVITVESFEQDGTVATDWTGTTVAITVTGPQSA